MIGYRLSDCVRLIEGLLDRRRDPGPIADVVAVTARPLPHSSGLLPGLQTAISAGVMGAATVAASTALDLPVLSMNPPMAEVNSAMFSVDRSIS
jgi:hypothetical protein